jgi:Spy/CpxP family protein refolding chaperone
MMKLARTLAFSLAVGLGSFALVACSGATAEQPQTASAAVTKAPVGTNTHGFVKLIGEALGEVPLRAEQRTELEKLATEAETRHAGMADGRKDLMIAIADQIEKGSVDRSALQPKIDRIVADVEKVRPDDQAALNRVHAILDEGQRNTFVDALEAKIKEQHGWMAKAHHGKEGFEGLAKLKQLADDMKLTTEQRAQIMSAVHEARKEAHAHGGAAHHKDWRTARDERKKGHQAFEQFRTKDFDAKTIGPQGELKPKATEGTTRAIAVAEKILPILTPEQRKIAADKLREHAKNGEALPFAH